MKLRKTLAGILGAVVMLLGVGTFEHVNRDTGVHAADGTYSLATTIAAGDTVVLACKNKNMELESIGSYGNGKAYSNTPAGLYPLNVVAGSTSGTYAFKTSDGKYLYWTSGNSLGVNATLNANTSWKVTFSGETATILNAKDNARKLQWNAGSPRFACYTSTQTAVNLYKWVESNLETLDTPVVTLNEATGVVTWAAITNANGYTYKLNGEEQNTQNTSVNLESGDTFSVKANGTDGKFNDSKYTEEITYTSYSDKVVDMIDAEYNEGHYLRHTIININADAVMEDLERLNENLNPEEQVNYADLFHAEVTMLERNTYFDGNQLWMENEEGTYSYYGTSGNDLTGGRVANIGDEVDTIALKNVGGMEGHYTTLTDIIEHSKTAAWTYNNDVYTSTNEQLIKDFLAFTAPCFYNAFSKDGLENYIKLSSITVQSIDDQVVLKLLVENGDSGKLVENSNLVLSQATISKFNIQSNDTLENPITINFDNKDNRVEFNSNIQVWKQNGITLTNNKASSQTNVADYADPARFYANSEIIIETTEGLFNVIEVYSPSSNNTSALIDGIKTAYPGSIISGSGTTLKITLTEAVSKINFTVSAQARATYITLSYEA